MATKTEYSPALWRDSARPPQRPTRSLSPVLTSIPSDSDLAARLLSAIDVPLYPLAGQGDARGEVGRDGDVEEEEQREHEGVYE